MACPLASNAPSALHTAKEAAEEVVRPDISWIPSFKVFKERVERLQILYPDRRTTVPEGWPAKIDHPRAWAGSDFDSESDYVMEFSSDDVAEIEAGLAHFKGKLNPLSLIHDPFNYPSLPTPANIRMKQPSLKTSAPTMSTEQRSPSRIWVSGSLKPPRLSTTAGALS